MHFNSHAHVERDRYSVGISVDIINFNSHAHVERDSTRRELSTSSLHFNSHAHVERDNTAHGFYRKILYFNSHAHVERDPLSVCRFLVFGISTHTLTWSVTFFLYNTNTEEKFQLTRSRGAWRVSIPMTGNDSAFQLTRSRGAWRKFNITVSGLNKISTHTLTWSVTGIEKPLGVWDFISTHTLTWSVTINIFNIFSFLHISTHTLTWSVTNGAKEHTLFEKFQLTRSRGAWRDFSHGGFFIINFNSHAHVERDWCFPCS